MISGLTDGLLTGEGDGQNNDYRYDAEQGQHNKYQVEEQVDGFVCTVKLLKARLVIGFGVIVLPPYIIALSGSIRRTIQLAIRIVAHPRTDCTNAAADAIPTVAVFNCLYTMTSMVVATLNSELESRVT